MPASRVLIPRALGPIFIHQFYPKSKSFLFLHTIPMAGPAVCHQRFPSTYQTSWCLTPCLPVAQCWDPPRPVVPDPHSTSESWRSCPPEAKSHLWGWGPAPRFVNGRHVTAQCSQDWKPLSCIISSGLQMPHFHAHQPVTLTEPWLSERKSYCSSGVRS